jgi:hypothetical protein
MSGRSRPTIGATHQAGWGAVLVLVATLWFWPTGAVSQDGSAELPPPPKPATVATPEEAVVPLEPVALASPAAGESEQAVSEAFGPAAATTSLSQAAAQIAEPGTVVLFRHDVGNLGLVADAKTITAASPAGWPLAVLAADGTSPLVDGDGDGNPDTDPIPVGQSVEIVVQVTVPADRPAGEVGVAIVTAGSVHAQNPDDVASVQDVVTVDTVVTLTVDAEVVDFGRVAADGRLDGAAPGVASELAGDGAYYVVTGAFSVTVASNAPWTGTCLATQDDGTAPDSWIAAGRLEWRLAGTATWTPFTTSGATCFPTQLTGTTVFVYDVRLRLERTDDAGTFRAFVTFAATA